MRVRGSWASCGESSGVKYKPDWEEARERLCALWEGRSVRRPCIAAMAPSGKNIPWPARPATLEGLWLDPEYAVAAAKAHIENTWWGGEAMPAHLIMSGWMLCFGGRHQFREDTIWHGLIEVDFERPPSFRVDLNDPWIKKFERVHRAVATAAGKDDFMVGQPCQLPANDLFSMQMGTERFLLALAEHPDWMLEALMQGARSLVAAFKHFTQITAKTNDFPYGVAGWMTLWAPERYMGTQSDVSCMMSPEMYDEFVLPELRLYAREIGPIWYHLDGGDAKQHLPTLLSMPEMKVIQYTPRPCEPPNGPAHIDFYRQVQAAGKIVHVGVPKENVEALVRELDPGLLMIETGCGSIREGEELLAAAETDWR